MPPVERDGVLTLGLRVGVVVGGHVAGRQVVVVVVPVPRLLHAAVGVVVGEGRWRQVLLVLRVTLTRLKQKYSLDYCIHFV